MDQTYIILLGAAAAVAIVSAISIRMRMRRDEVETTPAESPFAVSTEGMKVCPNCGMGNLWTDRNCMSCGGALKG